jgi:hypothetical protein
MKENDLSWGFEGAEILESKNKFSRRKILWILIIAGFAAIELPGIFLINRIRPFILGMPFIYGFVLLVWVFMCVVLFIAYQTNWGR